MRRINIMLKIVIYVCLIICSFFFLSACQGTEAEKTQPQKIKKELSDPGAGTFTAYSDATDQGYAWAKVTVKGDDVTDVKLMEILPSGNEKDYKTYKYEPAVKAHQEMPEMFEDADSAGVDVYSGATDSSIKYKEAVSRALDYANGGDQDGIYYDGVFQGESERTDYGYAVALVTIKYDDITDVQLKEADGDGNWKDFSNYDWEDAVEAHQEMAERFEKADSPEVDLYTNATQSSIRYKEAVKNALRHARKNPEIDVK